MTTSNLQLTSDLAFYGLAGTAAITLIGAVDQTNAAKKRQALALETVVNIIAAWVYVELKPNLLSGNIGRASDLRYVDWFLTTPLLLGSLALYLTEAPSTKDDRGIQGKQLNSQWLAVLLVVNAAMLICGFNGRGSPNSQAVITKPFVAGWLCFVFIAVLLIQWYYWVYMVYVFVAVWAMYGAVYLAPVLFRESAYNILDVISKSAFGVFLYFGWG